MITRRTFLAAAAVSPFARPLDDLRRKHRIAGLSAAIVRDGEIAWKEGFGFADVVRRVAAMPDTPYPIGWLTQTIASTLVLQLIEQGRVDLDNPIKHYIPLASPLFNDMKEGTVKIRHVLTHTSEGTPPGETFRFNPQRFAALTPVLAQLFGRPFEALAAERIYEPARMALKPSEELARPYRIDEMGRMVTAAMPAAEVTASSGLVASAVDLARFAIALDENVFARAETMRLARTRAESLTGKPLPGAFGWFVGEHKGDTVAWQFSESRGAFSGLLVRVPAKRTALVLLANTDALSRPFAGLAAGDLPSNEFARWFLDAM